MAISGRNGPFWQQHTIKQVSPQHHDSTIAKKKSTKSRDNKVAEQEGGSPTLKNNSNDASLKHMGY